MSKRLKSKATAKQPAPLQPRAQLQPILMMSSKNLAQPTLSSRQLGFHVADDERPGVYPEIHDQYQFQVELIAQEEIFPERKRRRLLKRQLRLIKVEEQIEAFNLAKSKQELLDTLQRVIEDPVVENLDGDSSEGLSCSVRNAPFESIEENEPSVMPVVEPLLRSEPSQHSMAEGATAERQAVTIVHTQTNEDNLLSQVHLLPEPQPQTMLTEEPVQPTHDSRSFAVGNQKKHKQNNNHASKSPKQRKTQETRSKKLQTKAQASKIVIDSNYLGSQIAETSLLIQSSSVEHQTTQFLQYSARSNETNHPIVSVKQTKVKPPKKIDSILPAPQLKQESLLKMSNFHTTRQSHVVQPVIGVATTTLSNNIQLRSRRYADPKTEVLEPLSKFYTKQDAKLKGNTSFHNQSIFASSIHNASYQSQEKDINLAKSSKFRTFRKSIGLINHQQQSGDSSTFLMKANDSDQYGQKYKSNNGKTFSSPWLLNSTSIEGKNSIKTQVRPSKYLSALPSIKGTPKQSPSHEEKKSSRLRVIAEERDLNQLKGGSIMGDTFYPDNLRMKQPFSGLDTGSNGNKGDLDSLSLTYTSFFSPNNMPVLSEERRLKTRALPRRTLNKSINYFNDSIGTFNKSPPGVQPKERNNYKTGLLNNEASRDSQAPIKEPVIIVPADRPSLALTRKKINQYLAKLERKNSLVALTDHLSQKSKKTFSQPVAEKRGGELRETLSKIYFGNNPPPDIGQLLSRGGGAQPVSEGGESSQSPVRKSGLKPPSSRYTNERSTETHFTVRSPMRDRRIRKNRLAYQIKVQKLYKNKNGMWLGELAGIKHRNPKLASANSKDPLRELVSTLSVAASKKPSISGRRNASITSPMDHVRSNNNTTSFGQDTVSSYTRNGKSSVIKEESTNPPVVQVKQFFLRSSTQRFQPKPCKLQPPTTAAYHIPQAQTGHDFGIDHILCDLKNSTKTIERILTNEKLHRRNGDSVDQSALSDSLMLPSMARSFQRGPANGAAAGAYRQDVAEKVAKTFEISAEGEQEMDMTESIVSEDLDDADDRVNFK